MIGKRRDPQQGTGGGALCLRGAWTAPTACSFVLVRAWLHLAVAYCEGEFGCVGDSFAHHCHARHPGKVGHFVLQGTLKHRLLGLCRLRQGQECGDCTLGFLSFARGGLAHRL